MITYIICRAWIIVRIRGPYQERPKRERRKDRKAKENEETQTEGNIKR